MSWDLSREGKKLGLNMLKDCQNITQAKGNYGITLGAHVLFSEAGFNTGLCYRNGCLIQKLFESGKCLRKAAGKENHVWNEEIIISHKCNCTVVGI